jgi:hypothetical protein
MTQTTWMRLQDSAWRRMGQVAATAAVAVLLTACGGGSDSDTGTEAQACSNAFTDSFGNSVSAAALRTLPGADFVGGGEGAGDAGADGTGADGAAIANAAIRITDADGKVINTTTDASGYFRVNIGGMKQPLVASVQRSGNAWKSAMIDVIQSCRSSFYTLNLTGLTDLVLAEVAAAAGVSGGSDAVTPAVLAANSSRVSTAVQTVNQRVSTQLQAAGLDPTTFNPLTSAFRPDATGYDKVLDSVTITKTSGGTTTIDTSGGGGSTLTGQWEMFVTVEGQEFSAGTVDGSVVPATEVLAATDYNVVLSSAGGTYTSEGYTVTVNGNSVTTVGPNVNLTTVINNFTINSYSGCGSCGVGSNVSFAYTYDYTFSGTAEGQSFNNLNFVGSAQVRYVRRS